MNRSALLETPLRDIELTAVDFETTGSISGWPEEPWQIGMVRFQLDPAAPFRTCESLLRVGDRPFHPSAPGRHREIRAQIHGAPEIASLLPSFLPWWGGGVVVAHNASTERRIIRGLAPLHTPALWLDTLPLARRIHPALAGHALEDLVPGLGFLSELQALQPGRGPHDALYDACACALLMRRLADHPGCAGWTLRDWINVK